MLEVGYVGNRGLHLLIRSDVNDVPAADRLAYVQDTGDGALRGALRPFEPSEGRQFSHLLHAKRVLELQFVASALLRCVSPRNSMFQFAYTWSKLISDTQLIDTPALNVDHYNPSASRGPDLLNRPHILVSNVVFNLPALQDKTKLSGALWFVGSQRHSEPG